MSKIPGDMRDYKNFKYKEYIKNHPELELNEIMNIYSFQHSMLGIK